jgi:hypothetical protein
MLIKKTKKPPTPVALYIAEPSCERGGAASTKHELPDQKLSRQSTLIAEVEHLLLQLEVLGAKIMSVGKLSITVFPEAGNTGRNSFCMPPIKPNRKMPVKAALLARAVAAAKQVNADAKRGVQTPIGESICVGPKWVVPDAEHPL